jgi:hypothetical protein
MYWGGTIKGETYGKTSDAPLDPAILERFEADAGKRVTFINTGQAWATFDSASVEATIEEGAIPLVTMGLKSGVTLRDVVEGKQDTPIREWARAAKAFGYPFLFRPWWEMNGGWYSWGRNPDFIPAWEHFHRLVEEEGATNVTWAWIVNAIWFEEASPGVWSYEHSDPTPYYPGDEFVDWVGMDAYNWGLNTLQPDKWRSPAEVIGPTLELLETIAPGKPVCICEDASTEEGGEPGDDKAAWIHEMLGSYLPAHPAIKAFLWFNWNVEQSGKPGSHWDWPIESSPEAEEAFREGIQGDTYLDVRPPLTPLAEVPMPTLPPPPSEPEPPVEAELPIEPVPEQARSSDTAGAPPAPEVPAAPSPANRLRLLGRRFHRGDGTATLTVRLPGPGTLRVVGRGVGVGVAGPMRRAPRSFAIGAAGSLRLGIGSVGLKQRVLRAHGRVKLRLRLTFTPTAGTAREKTVTLVLHLAPH